MNLFEKSRPPFPLTDEQVIREALKTVTEYANHYVGDAFSVEHCIGRTVASVKDVWRRARGYAPHQALKWDDQDEIAQLLLRIKTDLRARAYIKATECLKNRKILEINKMTAEALITYELRRRGIKHFFEWQKLRVKVSIKLECGRAMTFIVKYKDIREGKLQVILDGIMAVVGSLNNTGVNITVWPLTGSWNKWNGWRT